jgi:hypothetical protein
MVIFASVVTGLVAPIVDAVTVATPGTVPLSNETVTDPLRVMAEEDDRVSPPPVGESR